VAQVKPFCRTAYRTGSRADLAASLEELSSFQLYRLLLVLRLVALTSRAERRILKTLRGMRARLWVLAYGSLIETSPPVVEGIRRWETQKLRRSS
jgi:hypothetical protein